MISVSLSVTYLYNIISLKDYAKKVRELRRILEELRYEKEIADTKASRTNELEEIVRELKTNNRSLEDRISRLCETPFISEAFSQMETKEKLEACYQEIEDYKAKISHLQEAVKTQFSALTSLKEQASLLRQEKDDHVRMAEEANLRSQDLQSGIRCDVYVYVFVFACCISIISLDMLPHFL